MTDDDRQRFERALLPHLGSAYALAWWLMRDEDEARDAVQEACLRALRFFGSFRGGEGRGWFLKIVRNACHELRARGSPEGSRADFDEDALAPESLAAGSVIAFPLNPEAAAIERAGAEAVREALRSLPPDFREVIVLRELHELSYREIADITGIPIGTVMSRLSRGRKVLAAKIAGLGRRLETGT